MNRRNFFSFIAATLGSLAFWRKSEVLEDPGHVYDDGTIYDTYQGISRTPSGNEFWSGKVKGVGQQDLEAGFYKAMEDFSRKCNEPKLELMTLDRYNKKLRELNDPE